MRFTVIGHACLYIETSGPTVLVDPWLTGSTYWRSWWHFPDSGEPDPSWIEPDHVYLTHHHWDHFHYPSMRRIDRKAEVLVPKFGVDVMAGEVRSLGFERVHELEHGVVAELGGGVRLASYQYGFDDTLLIVQDGDVVVADLNDCKIRGRALEAALADFGPITFMLKTHSWAQSYPLLYTADDPEDLSLLTAQTYLDEFVDAARVVQPRYAVPFANMVGFLHPESWEVNAHMITPDRVAKAMEGADGLDSTEFVPMSPGDTWSSQDGFTLGAEVWWHDRQERMVEQARAVAPVIDDALRREADLTLSFDRFASYFEGFLRAVPRLVRGRLLARPVVFQVPGDHEPYWVVDGRQGTVTREAADPADRASLVSLPPALMADAIEKQIFHFLHGTMRIRTHLRPGGVNEDLAFWGLLMIWEIGYLPVRRLLSIRFARTALRRRREGYDALGALRGEGSPLERLSSGFATSTEEPSTPG